MKTNLSLLLQEMSRKMLKNKMFLRVIATFSTICMVCSFGVSADSSQPLQPVANILSLKDDLCIDIFEKLYEDLELEKMYTSQAPEDYAGIYADENQNLVLCVTEGNEKKYSEKLSTITNQSLKKTQFRTLSFETKESSTRIEVKRYSYNLLNSIQTALENKFSEFGITQTTLYQEQNCIQVTLKDEKKAEDLFSYLSQTVPSFEQGAVKIKVSDTPNVPRTNYAYNGVKFYHALFASTYGTLGFNGSYTDSSGKIHYGVFTNGHVAPVGKTMKVSAFGTVGKTLFSYIGGSLDIAFVEFNSGWGVTSRFTNADSGKDIDRAATASEFFEGALTKKYGAKTGQQDGKVLSTSIDVTVDYDNGQKTITDCFQFSNKTQGGDSGGPVGKQQVRQTFKLYGLTFASPKNSDTCGYGIKLTNIRKKYNIKVYGSSGWS